MRRTATPTQLLQVRMSPAVPELWGPGEAGRVCSPRRASLWKRLKGQQDASRTGGKEGRVNPVPQQGRLLPSLLTRPGPLPALSVTCSDARPAAIPCLGLPFASSSFSVPLGFASLCTFQEMTTLGSTENEDHLISESPDEDSAPGTWRCGVCPFCPAPLCKLRRCTCCEWLENSISSQLRSRPRCPSKCPCLSL